MIGVIADASEHDVVSEFFELFKTPWEFFRPDRTYEVVLCAGNCPLDATAKLLIVYAGKKTESDEKQRVRLSREYQTPRFLTSNSDRVPIYGSTVTFANEADALLKDEASQECAGYVYEIDGFSRARIGYDLFSEVRSLLTVGQPPANANIPTLEVHIALLRHIITGCNIPLVEIPPVPEGFNFIACLTHDVDHPSIRQHKWDHTMFGFLYRATVGSLQKFVCGRSSLHDLLANWVATLKLPLVYLGFAKDFWREFADRYQLLEQEVRSTFFILPFKNRPGKNSRGSAPPFRASGYGADDIGDIIHKLTSSGQEVGLHGIDAWIDSSAGREELKEIQRLTGISSTGVRMHWLYYDQNSPSTLEQAGAAYDSTFGYNETVGYRAGTTQVFKPLATDHLMELPLHVMDTALFYPSRLEMSPKQASALLTQMQDKVVRFGGVLTVNWHDRSVVPERLWDAPYRHLLATLKSRGTWFATAGETVSWFQMRRSAIFEIDATGETTVRVKAPASRTQNFPALRLRTHAQSVPAVNGCHSSSNYFDVVVGERFKVGASPE